MTARKTAAIILRRYYHFGTAEGFRVHYVDGAASEPRWISLGEATSGWQVLGLLLASERMFQTKVTRGIVETIACREIECEHCRPLDTSLAPVRNYYRIEGR